MGTVHVIWIVVLAAWVAAAIAGVYFASADRS
jgi:hypothetical protein